MFLRRKKKLINHPLKILLVTNALILFAGAMLGPIYALFVEEVGGDLLDAGIAGGLFSLTAGITIFLIGRLSDKLKRPERLIAIGYLVIALGFGLMILVNSVLTLFLVQMVIGMGEALYSAPFDGVYSRHLDKKMESSQWGLWELMAYFTAAIGAFTGGLIAFEFGFSMLFVIMVAMCLASALYILFLPKRVL